VNKKSPNDKRKASNCRLPGGFPRTVYSSVQDARDIYDDFAKLLARLQGIDVIAASDAREAMQWLLFAFIWRLLELAKVEPVKTWFGLTFIKGQEEAKDWAGKILASIGASIGKRDKSLSKTNAAYLSEKDKINSAKQLVQVIGSPKPFMKRVQHELKQAENHRKTLLQLKGIRGEDWMDLAKFLEIPEDYFPFVELPEPSLRSESQWRECLWPVFKKNNPDLLQKLRGGKFPTLGIRHEARWAKYRKDFRQPLHTLLRLGSAGVL
jgi:hypothetical protein